LSSPGKPSAADRWVEPPCEIVAAATLFAAKQGVSLSGISHRWTSVRPRTGHPYVYEIAQVVRAGRLRHRERRIAGYTGVSKSRREGRGLLVAQAILEPARLLTVDGPLRQYSDLIEIVTA
jgi:hypothetical protein